MIEGLDTWGPEFELRFVVLDTNTIINNISPECVHAPNETAEEFVARVNAGRDGFYKKLEISILKEGFRNPILVVTGWSGDLDVVDHNSDKIHCLTIGGSRLWIAQKHGLDIPCIVADYVERFKDAPLIDSVDEVFDYYKDKPELMTFGSSSIGMNS